MVCRLQRACGGCHASSPSSPSSMVTLLLVLVFVHLSDAKTLPGESRHLHHQQPGESHLTLTETHRDPAGGEHPSSQHGERTTPFCMVDGHKRSLSQALQNGHPDRLECVVQFGGTFYSLDLDKNHGLLPKPPNVFYYLPNGTGVSMEADTLTLCYYHGSVRGFPQSRVALSTCSGLRGIVALNSTLTFELQPEEGEGDRGEGEESGGGKEEQDIMVHLLYPTTPPEGPRSASCGVSHTPVPPLHVTAHTHRRKRDILSETKYIELVLVADHQEYLNYQRNNKTIIYRMLDVANQVDWFYRALNVRVALTGLEIWSDKDKIHVDRSPAETLNRFLDWRTRELLPRLRHDNAQLVMGESFGGTTVGMASQSSMCSRDRSGGVNVDHLVSVLGVASTVAHELGHNLGMSHDTADRRCHCDNEPRMGGCIMEPSTGLMPGQQFSSCSASDLSLSLLHGGGMCLFNVPQPDRLMGGPRCGNLYVERGEECDCGLIEECDDPCCNASTCKLFPGAQCSSDGICCHNCKLRTAGWVCREPLGECDLPEHCTGTSPYCPPNVYLQNGEQCEDGASYCWGGVCASLNAQCQTLWGANSTKAPAVCFSSVNKQGNKYGNCGQLANGSYITCSTQDVMCGRIQCQGGAERPLLGTHAEVTRAHFGINHSDLVCRGIYFHLGDDVSDPATVAQGTACGPGKACVNQMCQDVSVFGVEECRNKCNGHGVCNSNTQCHCDVGWAPPDCVYAGHGGSVDSGPARATRESGAVHIALLVIFLFIVPVILLFLILRFPRCRHRLLCLRDPAPFDKTGRHHNRTPVLERVDSRNGDQVRPLRYQWNGQGDIPMTTTVNKVHGRPAPPTKPLPPDPDFKKPQLRIKQRPAPPAKPLPPDPYAPTNQSAGSRPAPPSKPLPPDPQDAVPLKPLVPRKPFPMEPPPLPQYTSNPNPPLPEYPGCSTASTPLQHGDNGPALLPNRRPPLPPSRPPHLKKPNTSPHL